MVINNLFLSVLICVHQSCLGRFDGVSNRHPCFWYSVGERSTGLGTLTIFLGIESFAAAGIRTDEELSKFKSHFMRFNGNEAR